MTKNLRVLLLLLVGLFAAGCAERRKPEPQLDPRHTITVDGTTLRYNGRELRWDVPADKWQEVLGPRSRQDENVSVWDDLGVYLYHDDSPGSHMPLEFAVLLGRKRHSTITTTEPDFWPKQLFRGRLVVDGGLIHKELTIQEIVSLKKKGPTFRRAYLPTIYDYYLNDFLVGLDLGHDRTLTSFSISHRRAAIRGGAAEERRMPSSN